jgi:hypothetical protein
MLRLAMFFVIVPALMAIAVLYAGRLSGREFITRLIGVAVRVALVGPSRAVRIGGGGIGATT